MRLSLIAVSLILFLNVACSRLNNATDPALLACGIESKPGLKLFKVDQGSELEAIFITSGGEFQKLEPTSKACLALPADWKGSLYLRDKNQQDLGVSIVTDNADQGLSLLTLSSSDHVVRKTWRLQCPEAQVIQNQLILKALGSDAERAHLPATLMTISDAKGQSITKRQFLLNDSQVVEKLDLANGTYRLALENFDAFAPDVREPAQSCEFTVDRSSPVLNVSSEGINEVRPGQALTFPVSDESQVQIYLCAKKRAEEELASSSCAESEYIPIKEYVAPESGVWDLSYFAKDEAGNISRTGQQTIAVFHRETIEQIRLLSNEFQHILATSTQEFKAFKTYQKLLGLAQKLILKAEIKEVYWKLLGNFASLSTITLVSRQKLAGPPEDFPSAVSKQTVSQGHPDYPYRMTLIRNALQFEFNIYDTRYPKMKPTGATIAVDATQNSYGAILQLHPKIPYLVYVASGRFLLEFDLRKLRYSGSGENKSMFFPSEEPYKSEVSSEHVITSFTVSDDGRFVTFKTAGGWLETHTMRSSNQSFWPQNKICGRGSCRFDITSRTSVSYDRTTHALVWQADKEGLEKTIKSPVELNTWETLDHDTVLLLGRDKSLRLWSPRDGTLKDWGTVPHNPYKAVYQPRFQAVIVSDFDNSSVFLKAADEWQRIDRVYTGKFLNFEDTALPLFSRDDKELGPVVDIFDKGFALLKTMPAGTRFSFELSVKGSFLYFVSTSADVVERIDLLKQEKLDPLPLPQGYEFEAGGHRLVLKRWNIDKHALDYYEFMPEDGRLMLLDGEPQDGVQTERTIVDADGSRFHLSDREYHFIDAFHGIHVEADDAGIFYKDAFTVDPVWFDERLRTRPLYLDPE